MTDDRAFLVPGEVLLTIEDGPRPVLPAGYAEVPILTIPFEYSIGRGTGTMRQMLSAAEPHVLSLHQYRDRQPGFSILVRRDASGRLIFNNRLSSPGRDYETWWAMPARIAAAPFTFTADVLLSPVYLACVVFRCRM